MSSTSVTGPELVCLSNGVRVALDPLAGLETVALGAWIKVGSRWESAEQNGLAHLFEHMAFKGGGARDARQLVEAIEAVGGYMNAGTSYERTSYYARALGRDAGLALDLIADVIFAPRWTDEELEKEKHVVSQERGEAFDQADDRVFELHQRALFPDQPLGRSVLGEEETLAHIRVADLEAFKARHYAPSRVVAAISGRFDRAEMLELLQRRFGAIAPCPDVQPAPAQPHGGAITEARKLEQVHIALSWPGPPAGVDAMYAARLLAEIYGGGMASRLFQEVREQRGLVYQIDSYLDSYQDVGRLGVYAACAAKHAEEVTRRAADILHALAEFGPTDAELSRAKAVVAAQTLMGAETPMARAESRASQILLRGEVLELSAIQAKVNAVAGEELRAIARAAIEGAPAASAVGPKQGLAAAERFPALFA